MPLLPVPRFAVATRALQSLKDARQSFSYKWFDRFQKASIGPPTWPLNQEQLSRTTIYWPTTYQWPPSSGFLDPIRLGIGQWAKLQHRPIAQPYAGICVFELTTDGQSHRIAIDYSDYVERIERDCLATVSLYFKMQYLKKGYDLSEQDRSKLRPGGYITGDRRLTPRLPAIREAARNAPPQFAVYGRFGLDFATEIRGAVVDLLRSDPALGYEGGMRKVPYRQSMLEASRSKICIDLPGNGDFCFRLLDYLAVGAFVIAYPHRTTLPLPLIHGHHLVYMRSDLSDLIPLCRHYLQHEDERRVIQSNAAVYFDQSCHYGQLGSWYLQQCLDMATGVQRSSELATGPELQAQPTRNVRAANVASARALLVGI
jgi:hypothetical protein